MPRADVSLVEQIGCVPRLRKDGGAGGIRTKRAAVEAARTPTIGDAATIALVKPRPRVHMATANETRGVGATNQFTPASERDAQRPVLELGPALQRRRTLTAGGHEILPSRHARYKHTAARRRYAFQQNRRRS